MFRKIVLALALSIPAIANAAPTAYRCEFEAHTRWGWIPEDAIFVLDRTENTAMAFDGVINEVHGAPIPVTTRELSDSKVLLSWTLKNVPTYRSAGSTVTYQVRFDVARQTATVRALLHSADNENRGSGRCSRIKS